MKGTAKFHVNYNGVWYAKGDVIDVADADKFEMADYCDFDDKFVLNTVETVEEISESADAIEDTPRRGRRKKSE